MEDLNERESHILLTKEFIKKRLKERNIDEKIAKLVERAIDKFRNQTMSKYITEKMVENETFTKEQIHYIKVMIEKFNNISLSYFIIEEFMKYDYDSDTIEMISDWIDKFDLVIGYSYVKKENDLKYQVEYDSEDDKDVMDAITDPDKWKFIISKKENNESEEDEH
jgi:hypothetical protein